MSLLINRVKILLRDPSYLKEYRQEPDSPADLAARQLSEGAVSVSRRALCWIYQGQEKK